MTRKTVLVTGAGSGIGRALAAEAHRRGHRLILAGRRPAALAASRAWIGAEDARCVTADVTTTEGRAALVEAAGPALDILINNAGLLCSGPLGDLDEAALDDMLQTNVAAPLLLTRDLLPALQAARGQVVNVGSVFGDIGYPYFAAYSTSKFALRGFSEAIRRELAPRGIAVTYLAPRATRTDATSHFDALVGPMKMAVDDADAVARHAWIAIAARRREQFPKSAERLFVLLQRLAPWLIDGALIKLARDPAVMEAATIRAPIQMKKRG